MDIQVDPSLINRAYKQLLAETQSRLQEQVVTLQAACTQLQDQLQARDGQVKDLTIELETLKKQVMAETGRQDGVPQDESD